MHCQRCTVSRENLLCSYRRKVFSYHLSLPSRCECFFVVHKTEKEKKTQKKEKGVKQLFIMIIFFYEKKMYDAECNKWWRSCLLFSRSDRWQFFSAMPIFYFLRQMVVEKCLNAIRIKILTAILPRFFNEIFWSTLLLITVITWTSWNIFQCVD